MSIKRTVTVLAVVALAVGLSACSGNSGSMAARVGDQLITEAQIESQALGVEEILSVDPENYGSLNGTNFVLQNDILAAMIDQALDDVGIQITDDDRSSYWQSAFDPAMAEYTLWDDPRTHDAMRGYIDYALIQTLANDGSLDTEAFMASFGALSVEVNPRYGQWDASQGTVTSAVSGQASGQLATPVDFAGLGAA
ncbi:MAG: SurA N-terminal domain-containing protein [Propionibacteriaceae bacterium]|jgi:hypothetical protein|nr:SurA N-terminal domain-containing protein [Propionibacteriaceae bacterium]